MCVLASIDVTTVPGRTKKGLFQKKRWPLNLCENPEHGHIGGVRELNHLRNSFTHCFL